jgi:hypothetical protein
MKYDLLLPVLLTASMASAETPPMIQYELRVGNSYQRHRSERIMPLLATAAIAAIIGKIAYDGWQDDKKNKK